MMRFGIPEYRLPRTLIRQEIDKILSLGVTLRLKEPLTPEYGLKELRAQGFEAFFISVGVSRGRELSAPGVDLDGVVKAVDYLLNINRHDWKVVKSMSNPKHSLIRWNRRKHKWRN